MTWKLTKHDDGTITGKDSNGNETHYDGTILPLSKRGTLSNALVPGEYGPEDDIELRYPVEGLEDYVQ